MCRIFSTILLSGILMSCCLFATVSFTQTSTEDFLLGTPTEVIIEDGAVSLPMKAAGFSNWASTTDLPQALYGHKIVTWQNFAYLLGGFTGSSNTAAVYRAPLSGEGIGSWTSLASLPVAVRDHDAVIADGMLVVLGGLLDDGQPTDAVMTAPLDPDGGISGWEISSTSLPSPVWGQTAAAVDGYIYIIGGSTESGEIISASSDVYFAPVQPDGSIAEFTATSPLSHARNQHTIGVYNETMFILGGYDESGARISSTCWGVPEADGTISEWLPAADLPEAIFSHATTCQNGLITVIAGDGSLEELYSKKVYFASLSDAPDFNWVETHELLDRRIDGAAFIADGELVYAGGRHLAGNALNFTRFSTMTMTDQFIDAASFVSHPFLQLGSEMDLIDISYQIASEGSAGYEFLVRTAGEDAIWTPWTSAGETNPAVIGLSARYAQYMINMYGTMNSTVQFSEATLNIVGTQLTGNINHISEFTAEDSPYWATENIQMTDGIHNFEPGSIIMFSPETGLTIGAANVYFNGTAENPILLTSYNDIAGLWSGVHFTSESNGVESVMEYVIVENAGHLYNADLYCSGTSEPEIHHCTFRNADGDGIRLEASSISIAESLIADNSSNGIHASASTTVSLSNTAISSNGNSGMYYADSNVFPSFSGTVISGNLYGIFTPTPNNSFAPLEETQLLLENNGSTLAIGGGTISSDQHWALYPGGYAILGNVSVYQSGGTPTLTLDAGVTLKFADGTGLNIGSGSSHGGEILADGTEEIPIIFTSLSGESGTWNGITFDDGSDYSTSTSFMNFITIENTAGFGLSAYNSSEPHVQNSVIQNINGNGLSLSNAPISLENVDIQNCIGNGILISGSNPSLVFVDIINCGNAGYYMNDTVSEPAFYDCTITDCDFAFYYPTPNTSFVNIPENLTFSNILAGVAVPGGTISTDQTWPYSEYGYAVLGNLTVMGNDALVTLTIEAGNTVYFGEGVQMQIASYYYSYDDHPGALVAVGDEENPITFTSLNGESGGWDGIYFHDHSDAYNAQTELTWCIVENGLNRNIYAYKTTRPAVNHCLIRNSAGSGISLDDSDLLISESTIDNNLYGVKSENGSQPVFSDCSFEYNIDREIWAVQPNSMPSLLNCSMAADAPVVVDSGTQTINRTWASLPTDYIVSGDIVIRNDDALASLTIEPGNTIRFAPDAGIQIAENYYSYDDHPGELIANGTPDSLIVFTHLSDTSAVWGGLLYHDHSDAYGAASVLNHCIVEHAGDYGVWSYYTNLPSITNTIIRDGSGKGLYLDNADITASAVEITGNDVGIQTRNGSQAVFSDITLNSNVTAEIYAEEPNSFPTFLNCTANSDAPILIDGGTQSIDRTWVTLGIPYIINGNITVRGQDTAPRLTIDPGNTIKFAFGAGLQIAEYYYSYDNHPGALTAAGTPDSLITFTALNDSVGGWAGVYFYDHADYSTSSVLNYCVFEKGDAYNLNFYATTSPEVENCIIRHAAGDGLIFNNADITLNNVEIYGNGSGLQSVSGAQPTFTNAVLTDHSGYHISADGPNQFPTFFSSSADMSADILISGGTQTINRSWADLGPDYLINGSILVRGTDTVPRLTVEPGVTARFSEGSTLQIAENYYSYDNHAGELYAIGSAEQPISFTSQNETPGGWNGIYFHDHSDYGCSSTMSYCTVEFGASYNIYGNNTSGLTVDHCVITSSAEYGVSLTNSSPVFSVSQITSNASYGIYLSGSSNPLIGGSPGTTNDIFGNGGYNVYNNTVNNIDATHNFWSYEDSEEYIYDYYWDSSLGVVFTSPSAEQSLYGNMPPYAFSLISPVDGTVTTEVRPTFSWASTSDPEGEPVTYRLMLTDDEDWSDAYLFEPVSETSVTIDTDLEGGVQYWWRVRAQDEILSTSSIDTWSFVFSNEPTTPDLLSPLSGSTILGDDLLTWSVAVDPDEGDAVTAYQIQIDTDADFPAPVIDTFIPLDSVTREDALYAVLYSLDGFDALIQGLSYYWRVFSIDSFGVASLPAETPFYFNFGNADEMLPQAYDQTIHTVINTPVQINLTGISYIGEELAFALTEYPENGELSGTEPALTYMPSTEWLGTDDFSFTVSDANGTSLPAVISINVTPPNLPPELAPIGLQSFDEDSGPYEVILSASDPDGDDVAFSMTTTYAELGASISENVITLNPFPDVCGYFDITAYASDGELLDSETFGVLIYPLNDTPVIENINDQVMDEDGMLVIEIVPEDVDNSSLLLNADSDTGTIDFEFEEYFITILPHENWNGSALITVTADDLQDRAVGMRVFNLQVNAVNDAPVIPSIPHQITFVDIPLILEFQVDDVDGDELSVSSESDQQNVETALDLAADPPLITITPVSGWHGTAVISIMADDGTAVTTLDFEVSVIAETAEGYGCTDPAAINYNPDALVDDQSCVYLDPEQLPELISISDVNPDQGYQLLLIWNACAFDNDDPNNPIPVEQYSVWREDLAGPESIWSQVGTVTAVQNLTYSFVAPTLFNGSEAFFKVYAHTETPWINFPGNIMSGTSTDDLAPAVPAGLLTSFYDGSVSLEWSENPDEDFNYYTVYRDGEMLGFTSDVTFADHTAPFGEEVAYTVTAADFSLNESDFSAPSSIQAGILGDLNSDFSINVLDVVILAELILYGNDSEYMAWAGDLNFDGAHNVLDIVIQVEIILGPDLVRGDTVSNCRISYGNGQFTLTADGSAAGFQLEVTGDFQITSAVLPEGWEIVHSDATILAYTMNPSGNSSADYEFSYSGDFEITETCIADWHQSLVQPVISILPETFMLAGASPNPFNPVTTIHYQLPKTAAVKLEVFDLNGRLAATLIEGTQNAGIHEVSWNAGQLASGVYLIRMTAEGYVGYSKVMLIK